MSGFVEDNDWQQAYGPGAGSPGMGWGASLFSQIGGQQWGDMGNAFQKSSLGSMFGKLGGSLGGKLAQSGIGKWVGGKLASGAGQALMKGLGASNPAGLALMAGSKLLGAFGGAKKARKEKARLGEKIDEVQDALSDAGEIRDKNEDLAKDDHLTNVKVTGRGAARGKESVDITSEQAYEGSGFQESGQIDYSAEVATKQINEDFTSKKESLDKVLGQTLATNQEQFDTFKRQADETIASLESATITVGSNSPVSINLNDT